jgi:hypothetical protein
LRTLTSATATATAIVLGKLAAEYNGCAAALANAAIIATSTSCTDGALQSARVLHDDTTSQACGDFTVGLVGSSQPKERHDQPRIYGAVELRRFA